MHLDHCRQDNLALPEQVGNGWCWVLGFYPVAEGWVVRTELRIRSFWRLNLLGGNFPEVGSCGGTFWREAEICMNLSPWGGSPLLLSPPWKSLLACFFLEFWSLELWLLLQCLSGWLRTNDITLLVKDCCQTDWT